MDPTLDEVREELADIHEKLLAAPRDDFSTRADLRARQSELRQLSHELAEHQPMHDAATLKAAFNRLHKERDRMLDQHLSYDSTATGVGGIDGAFVAAVNKAMDEGLGVDEIESRMREILANLRKTE
jgi:hypothetical protein